MKIAIINDTHFGVRQASEIFLDHQEKFFTEQFFPYCKEHGITEILHLGDFFEHRKYVAIKTLNRTRSFFFDKLKEHNLRMTIIVGNHDVVYKNTNEVSSLDEILGLYPEAMIRLIKKPTVVSFDSANVALVPWINQENYDESMAFIASVPSNILMGHFEIQGFEMMKGGSVVSHGLDSKLFNKYEMVLSGHYHTKSTQKNIVYLGTQYELSWADCEDPKFFHILDTDTLELEPIKNNITLYKKLYYSDHNFKTAKELEQYIKSFKLEDLKDSYVKLVVTKKNFPKYLDKLFNMIQAVKPLEITTIEFSTDIFKSKEEILSTEDVDTDTFTIITKTVDELNEESLDLEHVKRLLHEIYLEALNKDDV